ncbi:hypothetical protein Mgra_00005255 [Meloidogyne graminicola]|uniref:Uncharacterized protein n=1 Tax=Meloidogyne graminicola TaxID=189291 RepID=A0A8S9ZQF0_9BILA|nr:hypothetical protein Mgra_00005255 [Meloidogyne graminicola]
MDSLTKKLDADLDNKFQCMIYALRAVLHDYIFMQQLADKKGKLNKREPFNFDEWCKEIDQHPAFVKELKLCPNGEYSAEIQALQALKYDEESSKTEEISTSVSTKTDKFLQSDVCHVWPLLILYPEHCQTDFIRECIDDAVFDNILAEVFEEPAEWDRSEHEFRASNVYLCMALNIQNEQTPIVREILPHIHSLGEVLKWPDIAVSDGIPVLQEIHEYMVNPKDKAHNVSSQSAGTSHEKYDEKVMLLQLRGVLDYEAVKRAAQNGAIRVREANTETPLVQTVMNSSLQVGSSFYSGEWTETLGTDMIFSINGDGTEKPKMEFVAVSDTRLSTKKVLLSKDDDTKRQSK